IGSYIGINAAGLAVGVLLGIQPHFWTEHGRALYSPYGLRTSITAMLIAHSTVAGAAEVIATVFALAYVQRVHPYLLERRAGRSSEEASVLAAPRPTGRRLPGVGVIAMLVILAVPL